MSDLFTIDFETFYSDEYSLKNGSTEDYVNDPRFEIIMVSLKKNDEPVVWFSGTNDETMQWLADQGIFEGAVLCHNTMFDALIIEVLTGRLPKMLLDTRLMAQAMLKPTIGSVSLDSCLKHVDVGLTKGTAVHDMKGRTRKSLSKQELETYANYCMNDTESTYRLFRKLAVGYPRQELEVIDMTLRMYLRPRFYLDATVLAEILAEVRAKKEQAMNSLPAGVNDSILGSPTKFAALLESLGVEVPMKVSPTTGKQTYAFAKTDTGFLELQETHADDPVIAGVLAARLGLKSSMEEDRCERLLDIAGKYQKFRVPLLYYGAHTGRYGGMEKVNPQNIPRVDKSRLRYALTAPKGHVVVGLDLAQIEARITAWLAYCVILINGFANKEDIYSKFATLAFGIETIKGRSKEDDRRRFVGKTCVLGLGFGMGAAKLAATLKRAGIDMDIVEVKRLVMVYRDLYSEIPDLWRRLFSHLITAQRGGRSTLKGLVFTKEAIILHNGMALQYHDLRTVEDTTTYRYGRETRTLWGGKITENIAQALARNIIMEQMLRIKRELGIVPSLQVHDELDYIVREAEAERFIEDAQNIMRAPISWAPGLPIDVEANFGPTFGDCK